MAKPYVQDAILAGPTPPAAQAMFRMAVKNDKDRSHDVLAVRFPPQPLRLVYGFWDRYRALVTWVPTKGKCR